MQNNSWLRSCLNFSFYWHKEPELNHMIMFADGMFSVINRLRASQSLQKQNNTKISFHLISVHRDLEVEMNIQSKHLNKRCMSLIFQQRSKPRMSSLQ